MLGYSINGKIEKVTGDPLHGYTKGKLCPKGFNYINLLYHPDRLTKPMMQVKRGSGKWIPLSWDDAYERIARKIISLYHRYGSHLSLALNKYSGNFGILHQAVEGMFNSLGPTTRAIGSPCWSSGLDAFYYDFGDHRTCDLEELLHANTILLWGVNPVWTSLHSVPYLHEAQKRGAALITIDPVYTATAKRSDLYVQVKPGGDGALAAAIGKILLQKGELDHGFIANHTAGWDALRKHLDALPMDRLLQRAGQSIDTVEHLVSYISPVRRLFTWIGFGLQRHHNGGQNIRSINALAAMTGNIGKEGSGVYYAHDPAKPFPLWITRHLPPGISEKETVRSVDINNFAEEIGGLQDPPVKFLWISCRNLITQNPDRSMLQKVLSAMEMIVTVDLFLTPTALASDLVLPATTPFEEWEIVPSYWHHWISINEPATPPYGECKSDLTIAKDLTKRLNEMEPGISAFPSDKPVEAFIEEEFTETLYRRLGINHWRELLNGPRRLASEGRAWKDLSFATPSGKFEFYSERARDAGLPPLSFHPDPIEQEGIYPYTLLFHHDLFRLNSQFQNIDRLSRASGDPLCLIHPKLAEEKGIDSGTMVRIYNDHGMIEIRCLVTKETEPNSILIQGRPPQGLNALVPYIPADMGREVTGFAGMALNDTRVEIDRI